MKHLWAYLILSLTKSQRKILYQSVTINTYCLLDKSDLGKTALSMTERPFLVWTNSGGKFHHKGRWHHFMVSGLGINEKENKPNICTNSVHVLTIYAVWLTAPHLGCHNCTSWWAKPSPSFPKLLLLGVLSQLWENSLVY